ncbi:MAG: hypothetical protein JKY96_02210 [Phycisphaerales bacterium]|nr:hypothetical protein [Phycisphaerales bacterium]
MPVQASSAMDILNIKIGMSLEKAKEVTSKYFGKREFQRFYLSSKVPQPKFGNQIRYFDLVFSDGVMFLASNAGKQGADAIEEMIVLYYDQRSIEKKVFAIFRIMNLSSFGITREDIRRGLIDKYGVVGFERKSGFSHSLSWSNVPKLQKRLLSSTYRQGYSKLFEEHCIFNFDTDFKTNPLQGGGDKYNGNPIWINDENKPLPFVYYITSERFHQTADFEFWSRSGVREEWFKNYLISEPLNKRKCKSVITASLKKIHDNIPGWKRLYLALFDVETILGIADGKLQEGELEGLKKPKKGSPPVKF